MDTAEFDGILVLEFPMKLFGNASPLLGPPAKEPQHESLINDARRGWRGYSVCIAIRAGAAVRLGRRGYQERSTALNEAVQTQVKKDQK
jgi:hypothetical protein